MNIGETIRKKRKLMQLTQGDLAAKLGISTVSVHNWEINKYAPKGPMLLKLMKLLQLQLKSFKE